MKFSLVIPVAPDRDAPIISTLNELDYKKSDFEIIVEKGTNPSDNRNRGAEKAKGKIIGFLDDDATVEKGFLQDVETFFNSHEEIDIAGGPQLTPKNQKGFAKISGYALTSKFGAAGTADRYKTGKLNLDADESSLTSANLFVKREVMKKIHFDSTLFPGEDPKFIDDAKKANLKVAYCPDFVIYHKRRETLKALIRQIFNYGKVRPAKENFRETAKKPLFLIPSLFVIYLLISSVFLMLNIYSNIAIIPLFVYAILNILFSIVESIKNKNLLAFFPLLFIYPIIHISYGTGMMFGYINDNKHLNKS